MVDGLVIKPEAEPPAIDHATSEFGPLEDRDTPVMRAAAKVSAAHERCLIMWSEKAARDPRLHWLMKRAVKLLSS